MASDGCRPEAQPRRVLCCGTFDHLHRGHEFFLKRAAALGDELYVVVARDENVLRIKGRRPDHPEEERRRRVAGLGIAMEVRLGHAGGDFLQVVRDIDPQVIALGYDQLAPHGLADAFPQCRLVRVEAFNPERYKSSLLRRRAGTDAAD